MKVCTLSEILDHVRAAVIEYEVILLSVVNEIIETGEPTPTKIKRLRNKAAPLLIKKIQKEVKK